MAQLSDDCFAFGGPLMSVDDARALIRERLKPVGAVEQIPLAEADGRVLAETLVAPLDLPPFANSAVDGYAVRHADLGPDGTLLPVAGRVPAGSSPAALETGPQAVRIFTGAPMPAGFDTVFMQEDVEARGGEVLLPPGLRQGANRRLAGEDLARGAAALEAGRRITPREVTLLAALGCATVAVRAPLRAALFSTGNEIVSPGERLPEAGLYDANRFMLASLLRRTGCLVSDLGILPDRREVVAEALDKAAARQDLIITSGGVSTG